MTMSPPLFFAHARTALKVGFRQLGFQTGNKVLIPDFTCDVLLHPMLQLGLEPVYYPVGQDLQPDWTALENIAANSQCQAILMIHYFGQPQDIEKFRLFCSHHNLQLVEDNAHGYGGYYQGRPLGSFGDIGISSPRKIIGTPSGGILHGAGALSSEFVRNMKPVPAFSPTSILKTLLNSMPKIRDLVKGWINRDKNWDNPRLYREAVQPDYAIDSFSRWRIVSTNWRAVAAQRRENWISWVHFARNKGLLPVFQEVHPESCPWVMPVYARGLPERNQWLAWGSRHGVSLFPWPTLPEEIILQDGDALARWRIMVCFPLDSPPDKRWL